MKLLTLIAMLVILCGCEAGVNFESKPIDSADTNASDKSDCRRVPIWYSTGTIRCWSGSVLVYQNNIYHNGGILCSVAGQKIDIVGDKSLCVIESSQSDAWEPPTN